MKKKVVSMLMASCMILAALSGCGSGGNSSEGKSADNSGSKDGVKEFTAFLKNDAKKDEILSNNPNMLMAMWVMSANYKAEKASEIPFILMDRLNLNSFDIKAIAEMDIRKIEDAMLYPSPIHRFCKKRAGYLHEMAKLIVSKYGGDAKNIWKDCSADEISKRILEFKGFGQKLSKMVPINLIRNLKMKLKTLRRWI